VCVGCSFDSQHGFNVVLIVLQLIQHQSTYICAGELTNDADCYHYSLNIDNYTSFTSPLRRYMDIVVGRLLGCYIDNKPSPYDQSYITDICYKSNDISNKARQYELASRGVYCNEYYRKRPVCVHCVVENPTESGFDLCVLAAESCFTSRFHVPLSSLNLCEVPVVTDDGQFTLKWARRVYDLELFNKEAQDNAREDEVLGGNKFIYRLSSSKWQSLVQSIVVGNGDGIITEMLNIHDECSYQLASGQYSVDVTSEGSRVQSGQQYVNFTLNLRNASVIQAQLSSDFVKGLLAPRLQLLNLTPTLDICIEHMQNVHCFVRSPERTADRATYVDVSLYQYLWRPVLAVETANQAVCNNCGNSMIIHHVPIKWRKQELNGDSTFIGLCQIPLQFAKERCIELNTSDDGDEDDDGNSETGKVCQFFI
jgi:RNB domain